MPNAWARRATSLPMFPNPITPRTLSRSSVPTNRARSQRLRIPAPAIGSATRTRAIASGDKRRIGRPNHAFHRRHRGTGIESVSVITQARFQRARGSHHILLGYCSEVTYTENLAGEVTLAARDHQPVFLPPGPQEVLAGVALQRLREVDGGNGR